MAAGALPGTASGPQKRRTRTMPGRQILCILRRMMMQNCELEIVDDSDVI
jgi:hypothetical protein